MVNKERVALLVAALRSGEFPQGKGCLHDQVNGTYCCLGVATVVAAQNGLAPADNYLNWGEEVLHADVASWYGFSPIPRSEDAVNPRLALPLTGDELIQATAANDDFGYNFQEIADAFERTYINTPKS